VRRPVALAACGALLLAGCNPTVQHAATASPSASPTASGLALKVSGHGTARTPVRFVQQVGNKREYDLLARSFESVGAEGSALVTFTDPHVTFHGKDGSTLIADAPRALLDQKANTITMQGGVRAHNEAGTSLTCDVLIYDHASEQIYGHGHVVIVNKNGFHATANSFHSNVALTRTQMQ
jgi:LPS export ABC transporter protein LptC